MSKCKCGASLMLPVHDGFATQNSDLNKWSLILKRKPMAILRWQVHKEQFKQHPVIQCGHQVLRGDDITNIVEEIMVWMPKGGVE